VGGIARSRRAADGTLSSPLLQPQQRRVILHSVVRRDIRQTVSDSVM
jgi:hypothetical protein